MFSSSSIPSRPASHSLETASYSSSAPPLVVSLAHPTATALPLVGGKAANLGLLLQAGLAVPPGFCVTTHAFELLLEGQGLGAWLEEQLQSLNPSGTGPAELEKLREVGARIRQRIQQTALHPALQDAVRQALEQQGLELAYAVRSSATAEDLPDASFAGQQDTYLGMRGLEQILDAIRRCQASLYTDRAIQYRMQQGFEHRRVKLAVVVQQLLASEVSGVLFTADPRTGHRRRMVIEACFGLGEALVSGQLDPDRFELTRGPQHAPALKCVETAIGKKQLAIWQEPTGGTRTEQLPPERAQAPTLTPEQVLTLARLGEQVEAHYAQRDGGPHPIPQDIEWGLHAGRFYLLQARPITTLYPLPLPAPSDQGLHAYLCFNHLQVMLDPFPPLAADVFRFAFPFGRGNSREPNPFMVEAGGRLYIDPTSLLVLPRLGAAICEGMKNGDDMAGKQLSQLRLREDFQANRAIPGLQLRMGVFLKTVVPIMLRMLLWLWWRSPSQLRPRVLGLIESHLNEADRRLAAASSELERVRICYEEICGDLFGNLLPRLFPVIGSGLIGISLVRKLLSPLLPAVEVDRILRGLDGNITTEMDLRVGDLADKVRPYPALAEAIRQNLRLGTPLKALDQVEGGPAFLAELDRFMETFGMRGPSEIDISRPRWRDEPDSLLQMLLGNVAHGELGVHRAHHARMRSEGEQQLLTLIEQARRGPLGIIRAALVKRLGTLVRAAMALREHPKYGLIQLLERVKRTLLGIGEQLVAAGRLEQAQDVFFLSRKTLEAALQDPNLPLREQVAQAQEQHRRNFKRFPPKTMTSEGEVLQLVVERGNAPEGALLGTAASAGVVEGIARVVTDPAREVLHTGEILVAPFTDPGWTPLFLNASGLVMEVGGLMTHGSVIAREYGIPAVVGVSGALSRLKTGQRLRVHGTEGYVEVLSEQT